MEAECVGTCLEQLTPQRARAMQQACGSPPWVLGSAACDSECDRVTVEGGDTVSQWLPEPGWGRH